MASDPLHGIPNPDDPDFEKFENFLASITDVNTDRRLEVGEDEILHAFGGRWLSTYGAMKENPILQECITSGYNVPRALVQ